MVNLTVDQGTLEEEENPFTVWTEGHMNQIEASPRHTTTKNMFSDEPAASRRPSPFKKLLPKRKELKNAEQLTEIQNQLKKLQEERNESSLYISKLENQIRVLQESALRNEPSDTLKQVQAKTAETDHQDVGMLSRKLHSLEQVSAEQAGIINGQHREIMDLLAIRDEQGQAIGKLKEQLSSGTNSHAIGPASGKVTELVFRVQSLQKTCEERNRKISNLESSLKSAQAIISTQATMIDQLQENQCKTSAPEEKEGREMITAEQLKAFQEQLTATKERVCKKEEDYLTHLAAKELKIKEYDEKIKDLEGKLEEATTTDKEVENDKSDEDAVDDAAKATNGEEALAQLVQAVDRVPSEPTKTVTSSLNLPEPEYHHPMLGMNSCASIRTASHPFVKPKRGKPIFSGTADFRKSRYHKWKTRHAILLSCKGCYQLRLMNPVDPNKKPMIVDIITSKSKVDRYDNSSSSCRAFMLKVMIDPDDPNAPVLNISLPSKEEQERWFQAMHTATVTESVGLNLDDMDAEIFHSWSSTAPDRGVIHEK